LSLFVFWFLILITVEVNMSSITVIKRNGQTELFDIAKIRKVIHWASSGLDVNPMELESNLQIHIREGMNTKEIHDTLIETALRLASLQEPDWRYLAARLKLIAFYKEVHLRREISYEYRYPGYAQTVTDFVAKNIYSDVLTQKYTIKELNKAGQFIKQEYDYDFDFAGISLMISRYMLENQDGIIEMPQEAFLSAALLIEQNQDNDVRLKYAKETYTYFAERKISLATPILINLRKPMGNLSSCFITKFGDNINSIFHTFEQIGQIGSGGGGVGVSLSPIRAQGSRIKGIAGRAGGVIPNIRTINDIALYFNQGGKRAGAVTVALDTWHLDIEDFLELQTENGDQRRKAYDVFPQVVATDVFMQAVDNNADWYLFDPHEIRTKFGHELSDLWGEEFECVYNKLCIEADNGNIELFKIVNAKNLYKHIMRTQIETGMPYITFKDTINRANPNPHVGMIPCTNLCVESFSVVKPSDVSRLDLESPDNLYGTKMARDTEPGLIHTCNLVSINMANVKLSEMESVCRTSVRILDNCIDITDVPVSEGYRHNYLLRTIGVGLMGLADYFAINNTKYTQAGDLTNELGEHFAYYTIKASIELAKERGAYPLYKGSTWSQGMILNRPLSWFEEHGTLDWKFLFDELKEYGIRNSHIQAIAPNTSSSIVQGCTASVLPIFNRFYIDNSGSASVPIAPPYIKNKFWFYEESKNVDQRVVVDIVSRLQSWTDTGISMELLFNSNTGTTAKDIYETHMDAWRKGCKAIYYTRYIQKDAESITDDKQQDVCLACAG
jgi:ribonucleoside-diphosphate reductase alpha chain